MIPANQLRRQIIDRLAKLPEDGALEVLTYKRNRGLIIWREAQDRYLVREHGYHSEVWENLSADELDKLLPKIAKREFPRSTKIRIYTHAPGAMTLIVEHPQIRI